jgi:hypothetical protein
MDITEVILAQHAEQRRSFALLDEFPHDDVEGLTAIWKRLEILLETHAEAEERYFYPELLKLGKGASDAKSEGVDGEVKDAIKDHNEIRDAIRKAREHEVCSDDWWKAVVECRVQNSDHMAEEERQDLADFRQHAGLDLRQDIAMRFLRYEAVKAASGIPLENKDPRTYVHDMGESS